MSFRLSTALRNKMLETEASIQEVAMFVNTLTFGDGDGAGGVDTITDSGNGLANFSVGDKIQVKGSASNDGEYEILTVGAGTVEVPAGSLAAEVADAVTVVLVSCRGGSFNDIFRNCVMRIFSGSQPSTADDTEIGTLLVELTRDGLAFDGSNGINFGETAANGILGKEPSETWSGQAGATDDAGWFRIYPNDVGNHTGADAGSETKIRLDGAIANSGAQLNMSSVGITSGGTTTIDSVAVTLPTA